MLMAASVSSDKVHDVLIVGGGPSGLSVATGLARQLYTAVIFDSSVYRNERAAFMHNVPGWDHAEPRDLRDKLRSDLARYQTIYHEQTEIEQVQKCSDGHFEARDDKGRVWKGRRVVLASGVRDIYPQIPGYDELWGRGIYHCLFCHGYEDRSAVSAGVLAIGPVAKLETALHMAYMSRRLARKVVVYSDGDESLAKQISDNLAPGFDINVENRKIEQLSRSIRSGCAVDVQLAGGRTVAEGFVVHKPATAVNGPFVKQLNLDLTADGDIKTSQPFPETSVPGVFAVGDCGNAKKTVTQAFALGALGASGIATQLQVVPACRTPEV